eukprot:s722_g22.t1
MVALWLTSPRYFPLRSSRPYHPRPSADGSAESLARLPTCDMTHKAERRYGGGETISDAICEHTAAPAAERDR